MPGTSRGSEAKGPPLSLKEAQEQGRMEEFIRQEEERVQQEHPDPRGRFAKLLRAMAGTRKS